MRPLDWKIPAAWLTLCVVWSSTWLAIKVGLRDSVCDRDSSPRGAVSWACAAIAGDSSRLFGSRCYGRAHVRRELHGGFLGGIVRFFRLGRCFANHDYNFRHAIRALDAFAAESCEKAPIALKIFDE